MAFNEGEFAQKYYEAAREELVMRIRLRDNALLIFLGFSAAIFGLSIGKSAPYPTDWSISLAVPFLGLGCAIIVGQHNSVIGALIRYVANDLKPVLQSNSCNVPEFVSSRTFKSHSLRSNSMRTIGHLIILITPSALSLAANNHHALNSAFPFGELWWFGLLCVLITVGLTLWVHGQRTEVYQKTQFDG
jgi:hypothetical protein